MGWGGGHTGTQNDRWMKRGNQGQNLNLLRRQKPPGPANGTNLICRKEDGVRLNRVKLPMLLCF